MLNHIWLVPLFAFLIVPLSFFLSYGWAVALGHVGALWPAISSTITLAPESCVFGELLNIGAVFIAMCMYLRHRQIIEFYETLGRGGKVWVVAANISLFIGICSAIGISMVANFQETRLMAVHVVGALMAFVGGIIYGWAQTIYSYLMKPRLSSLCLAHFRLGLCLLGTGFFFSMMFGGFTRMRGNNIPNPYHNLTTEAPFHVKSTDPDFVNYLVGDFSEWLMSFCFMFFILTFAIELRHAALIPPRLVLTGKIAEKAEWHQTRRLQAAGIQQNRVEAGVFPPPTDYEVERRNQRNHKF